MGVSLITSTLSVLGVEDFRESPVNIRRQVEVERASNTFSSKGKQSAAHSIVSAYLVAQIHGLRPAQVDLDQSVLLQKCCEIVPIVISVRIRVEEEEP